MNTFSLLLLDFSRVAIALRFDLIPQINFQYFLHRGIHYRLITVFFIFHAGSSAQLYNKTFHRNQMELSLEFVIVSVWGIALDHILWGKSSQFSCIVKRIRSEPFRATRY